MRRIPSSEGGGGGSEEEEEEGGGGSEEEEEGGGGEEAIASVSVSVSETLFQSLQTVISVLNP